jgi:hypothetical protein
MSMTQPTSNVTPSLEATPTPDQPNQPGAVPDANMDRDEQGRFKAGNRSGRGNPFARKTAALRSALINAVTEKDMNDIAAALLDKARQSDVAACKLVFSYALGKPGPMTDPDNLDQQELQQLAAKHVGYQELLKVINLLPIEMVLGMIHAMLPPLWESKAKRLSEQLSNPPQEDEEDEEEEDEAAEEPSPQPELQDPEEMLRVWMEEVEQLRARLSAKPQRRTSVPAPAAEPGGTPADDGGHRLEMPPHEQPQHAQTGVAPQERPSANGFFQKRMPPDSRT